MKKRNAIPVYLIMIVFAMVSCAEDKQSVDLKVDYKDFLSRHDLVWDRTPDCYGVSPTTMYAEGAYNPVKESPFSYATAIHEMLLQSWDGTIRVFPGSPGKWKDVAFHHLRTRGAFLVSARKKGGVTEFVNIKSLIGSPCLVQTDIPEPRIYINCLAATEDQRSLTRDGVYKIELRKDDNVIFCHTSLEETDLHIESIPVSEEDRNLFGYSKKTERLPGHQHYKVKGDHRR
jgi:alpha-L-fucosidase 2